MNIHRSRDRCRSILTSHRAGVDRIKDPASALCINIAPPRRDAARRGAARRGAVRRDASPRSSFGSFRRIIPTSRSRELPIRRTLRSYLIFSLDRWKIHGKRTGHGEGRAGREGKEKKHHAKYGGPERARINPRRVRAYV